MTAPTPTPSTAPNAGSLTTSTQRSTWAFRQRLPQNALGAALFSVGMVARVPYFGTVLPFVREMRPGYCEVTAPKWFGVYNHIGTFHAIAACNLAETAMGMLMEASTPRELRWIPKGMQVSYLTKATTRLRAVAALDGPIDPAEIGDGDDVVVPVAITDTAGVEVVHADITCWVTPA